MSPFIHWRENRITLVFLSGLFQKNHCYNNFFRLLLVLQDKNHLSISNNLINSGGNKENLLQLLMTENKLHVL